MNNHLAERAHIDRLDEQENKSIYIIRETYHHFRDIAALWSICKDFTSLLRMCREAFCGVIPSPLFTLTPLINFLGSWLYVGSRLSKRIRRGFRSRMISFRQRIELEKAEATLGLVKKQHGVLAIVLNSGLPVAMQIESMLSFNWPLGHLRACLIYSIISIVVFFAGMADATEVVRAGYFPNITHSQAIIGMANSSFKKALGENVEIKPMIFNAGPSVIEALFAGELDLAYIGPNPAINGYVKSKGQALRIIAGATSGGAGLVIRKDSGIDVIADFNGRKIASPQLGNTQDVALRGWLRTNGIKIGEQGGNARVIPINNPDQLTLFLKKEIDAAWTVEPWVSRLIQEGNGTLFLDERTLWPKGEFVTAHVIVSVKFLEQHRDLVKSWIRAHVELTQWINAHPAEARGIVNSELQKITGKRLPEGALNDAFGRLSVTYDPVTASLFQSARWAFREGFLGKTPPDLSGIYDLSILNEVLKGKGLPGIKE